MTTTSKRRNASWKGRLSWAWYDKVASFNVENLFTKKREPGPRRTVFLNEGLPEEYYDKKGRVQKQHVYVTNQVITSKYTFITFLPRNLLEQFRRIANIFFAGIAILQFFNKFSTISPGLVILPLILVLGITALKDGYEDVKRHQSDRQVNNSVVSVLTGGDWTNANAMMSKERNWLRTFFPFLRSPRSRKSKKRRDAEQGEEGLQEHELNTDREFDDDQNTEQQGHHLHHPDKTPHWKKTNWEDIRVGDMIKIYDNEPIPADVLICATSEDENVAFVETKNLDGETNLKSRSAVPPLTHLRTARECASKHNVFHVDCDRPDNNMYKLNATVRAGEVQTSADIQMTLLRGTVLRNTKWVIGIVLFTGEDTKIVMNAGGTPSKRGKVERQMNPQVFINLLILGVMSVVCGVVDSILEQRLYPTGAPWLFGDTQKDDNPKINGLVTWAFALITFQNIVPISLYISIEFVRTCQAAFIWFDPEMVYQKTGQPTLARSWNLSDDLGQIEYIFSDKTGTLTQNKMIFRQCSIGGKVYTSDSSPITQSTTGSTTKEGPATTTTSSDTEKPPQDVDEDTGFHSSELEQDLQAALSADSQSENAGHARALNGFMTVLALCHTVLTSLNPDTGKIEYKAQSPDEAALVQAAANAGYVFKGKDRDILTLERPDSDGKVQEERYELLNVLEFNSSRKRMSVVMRKLDEDGPGKVILLAKGADNVIFERLKEGPDQALKDQTELHLSEFANNGLRTLTLAYKVIPNADYETWNDRYHDATVSIENREENIEAVCDELEHDLRLLGATAIEDSLQDGVPETIADLKLAGIKVWVATGDKLETAIAIGHSTNLISEESNIIVVRGGSRLVYQQLINAADEFFADSDLLDEEERDLAEPVDPSSERPRIQRVSTGVSSIVGSENGDRPGGFVLVIDGLALGNALSDDKCKSLLLRLAMQCEGVICCRVSPLQKALVVRMVKDGLKVMTLAIGDGANDVSMIQAADVGVGISGEEGLQAVNSSDYAIAQFRFLKRLLFVHGHWSYHRNGNMIVNFFYKNIVCIGVLWWFQIYNGWSSSYVFDYTYLLFWNSFWTIAPVIGIGLFDRLAESEILMAFPQLYRFGREGHWFGMKLFSVYMLDGIYQSVIIYFIVSYTYFSPTSRQDGYDSYIFEWSTTAVFAAVMSACLFNGLNTNVWTGWVFFAVFIGIILLWLFTVVYDSVSPGWFYTPVFGNNHFLFRSAYFWLCLPITICLSLLPRYVFKAFMIGYGPNDIEILRSAMKLNPDMDLVAEAKMDGTLVAMRRQYPASVRSGSFASFPPAEASSVPNVVPTMSASQVDMSTGIRSRHRGFDFATEENGVAMRRIQTNLSERRTSSRQLAQNIAHTPKRKKLLSLLKRKPAAS